MSEDETNETSPPVDNEDVKTEPLPEEEASSIPINDEDKIQDETTDNEDVKTSPLLEQKASITVLDRKHPDSGPYLEEKSALTKLEEEISTKDEVKESPPFEDETSLDIKTKAESLLKDKKKASLTASEKKVSVSIHEDSHTEETKQLEDKTSLSPSDKKLSVSINEKAEEASIDQVEEKKDSETELLNEKRTSDTRLSLDRQRKVSIKLEERRLSRAITDFMKQRKSLPESEVDYNPTDVEKIEAITEPQVPHYPRRDSRYSRVIEDLEKQRRESMLLRSEPEKSTSFEKKIRFADSHQDTDVLSLSKGMTLQFKKVSSKACGAYLRPEEYSELFVEELIQNALTKTSVIKKELTTNVFEGIHYYSQDHGCSNTSIDSYIVQFEWPTLETFTPELGTTKIIDYLLFWEFKENWKYCVNYLTAESDKTSDFHRYEAIFSIPCKQYPVSQATASVYFTIEVSRVKPKECIVDVYYSFEGRRLVHSPGKYKPQEAWLFYIIDAKIKFYKKLKF